MTNSSFTLKSLLKETKILLGFYTECGLIQRTLLFFDIFPKDSKINFCLMECHALMMVVTWKHRTG